MKKCSYLDSATYTSALTVYYSMIYNSNWDDKLDKNNQRQKTSIKKVVCVNAELIRQ